LSAEISGRCRLTEYTIEKEFIEDTAGGKSINYSGYFLHVCDDATRDYLTDNLKLFFNDLEGEWHITGIDG
jgi:predicted phosphoadenosine phosphosulfate sulfurtransferase